MHQIVLQVRPGMPETDATLHSELLVGIVFALAEAQLDGRVEDMDRATAVASRAIVTSILATSSVADAA
jgi:hypothetical protein